MWCPLGKCSVVGGAASRRGGYVPSVQRVLRNLAFSVLLAGVVLGLLESGLRLFGIPDPGLYAGDVGSLWTLRAEMPSRQVPFRERGTSFAVRTNRLGFRGEEPASGGIVCLGDSTTFGWGVEEEEAWPARLAALLGEATVNGGVPGYSTVQGLATLDTALSLRPRLVVVAYLVRDAELGQGPDRLRVAGVAPPSLALFRLIRELRGARPAPPGTTFRVPPEEYAANVRELARRIREAGSEVQVLAFPMRTPPVAHLTALQALRTDVPILAPSLPDESFFVEDPIHLTPAGNAALAEQVAAALSLRPPTP